MSSEPKRNPRGPKEKALQGPIGERTTNFPGQEEGWPQTTAPRVGLDQSGSSTGDPVPDLNLACVD